MKHLGEYMLSLGINSFIVKNNLKQVKSAEPHIFTDNQLKEFFKYCDSVIKLKYPPYRHLIAAVIFRVIYCCGLRNSEACYLKCCDINLNEGTIKIYNSKGFKDRIIYMSEDLKKLCYKYNLVIDRMIPNREYFFPSSKSAHYNNTSVCKLFDSIIKKTSFYGKTSKKPTCHGLRHYVESF